MFQWINLSIDGGFSIKQIRNKYPKINLCRFCLTVYWNGENENVNSRFKMAFKRLYILWIIKKLSTITIKIKNDFTGVYCFFAPLVLGASYINKCYCPGVDPLLNSDRLLRNKMYTLKTDYTRTLNATYTRGENRHNYIYKRQMMRL
jgi:hypothetical protein